MRRLLAVLVTMSIANDAHADECSDGWGGTWTTTDTAIEGAVLATLAVDYIQTKQIVADGRESNMLLGEGHISPDAYFLTVTTAHVIAMRILPPRWRHVAQGLTIGAQTRSIARNWQAGYTLRF